MSNQRVNFCMISFLFNFLAEASLRSLPKNINVVLIHVKKTRKFALKFQSENDRIIQNCIFENKVHHGNLLDLIFSTNLLGLRDSSAVVFLDHDCWFENSYFEPTCEAMCSAIEEGCLIAAHRPELWRTQIDKKYFETRPMFTCKSIPVWPTTWGMAAPGFDNGQYIGKILLEHDPSLIKLLPAFTNLDYHWTNDWFWMDRYVKQEQDREVFVQRKEHYRKLAESNLFTPSDEEMAMMSKWSLLSDAVRVYRER